MNLITLTTDFGTRDWYVGTMKGVMMGRCPSATIVDLTHDIPQGDVRAGAFALAVSYGYFPKGTVHVAVIDPGVGSSRPALAIETRRYFFVGPDNGVLSLALNREEVKSVRRIENQNALLQPVSQTFHGRDVFAPVAARLCRGFPIKKLGPAQREIVRLPWPEPTVRRKAIKGEIVFVDRFGNLITNIGSDSLKDVNFGRLKFIAGGSRAIPLATHYQAVPAGNLVAMIGSSGLLEIAVNGGSAAQRLGLAVGARIEIALRATRRK